MAIKKVADIPEDYDEGMKPIEWVICVGAAIALIWFIVSLLL